MNVFIFTILLALFALADTQCVLKKNAAGTFNDCTYTAMHNPQKHSIAVASNSYRNISITFQSSYIPIYKTDVLNCCGSFKLISLTVTRSKLQTIEPGALGSFAFLEAASFDRNNISRLQSNVFKSKTLRYLNVSFNNISVIESEAFNNVPLLLDLDLSHNNISEVKSEYFKDVHFIRSLNLSYNSIRSLETFVTLSNLLELNLKGNFLKDVSGLPATLEILDVSKNYLTKLKHSMFSQTNLKYLDVSSNGIKEIDWNVFRDLSLSKLTVSDNKIKYFNGSVSTKKIAIDGNTFNCDELIVLLQTFKIHDVAVENGGVLDKINVHGIACSVNKEDIAEFEDEENKGGNITHIEKVAKVENVTEVANEQNKSRTEENQLNPIEMTTSYSADGVEQIISGKTDKEVLNEINWQISVIFYSIYAFLGLFVLVNVAYVFAYYFGYQIRYFGRNNQSNSKELVAIM